jgi:hypothetical protein
MKSARKEWGSPVCRVHCVQPAERRFAPVSQKRLGVELAENLDQTRNDTSPSGWWLVPMPAPLSFLQAPDFPGRAQRACGQCLAQSAMPGGYQE